MQYALAKSDRVAYARGNSLTKSNTRKNGVTQTPMDQGEQAPTELRCQESHPASPVAQGFLPEASGNFPSVLTHVPSYEVEQLLLKRAVDEGRHGNSEEVCRSCRF